MTHTGFNTHAGFDGTLQILEKLFKNLPAVTGQDNTTAELKRVDDLDALVVKKEDALQFVVMYSALGSGSYGVSDGKLTRWGFLDGSETTADRIKIVQGLIEPVAPQYAELATRLDSTERGSTFSGHKPEFNL